MKNNIKLIILKKAAAEENPSLVDDLKEKLRRAWEVTRNKSTYIINNRSEISTAQLKTASEILDVPMEKLINHEETADQQS